MISEGALGGLEEVLGTHLLLEKLVLQLGTLRIAEVSLRGGIEALVRGWVHALTSVALEQVLVGLHESRELASVAFSIHFY